MMGVISGLKKIKRFFSYPLNVNKWRHEYITLKSEKTINSTCSLDIPVGKTLVIVPHADDEIFGAYGFIKNNPETELFFMGFTGSNTDVNNKIIRDREFMASAKALGLNYYFADNNVLTEVLDNNKYENILCPSIVDWHDEHRLCSKLLLESLAKAKECRPDLFWYDVTVPIMTSHKTTVCIPMTEDMQKEKYKLFKRIYKSQSFMPTERFAFQERINAFGTGYYACEIICKVTYDELTQYVNGIYSEENSQIMVLELNSLKKNISGLRKIREESKRLYFKLEEG